MVRARLFATFAVLALAALGLTAGPAAAAQGGNSDTAHACQQGGWQSLTDPATGQPFTSQGACVSSGAHGNPPVSTSLVATQEIECGGACWGTIVGTGLQPGSEYSYGASFFRDDIGGAIAGRGFVGADGRIDLHIDLACGQGWGGLQASGTTAAGTPISSNVANSPCG
jgi:hypothetical protein